MKCCDVRTNFLKQYHKECMKNSVEKTHADFGAKRVKERVDFCSISFDDFLVGHHLSFARQTVDIAPTQPQVCGYLFLAGLKLFFYLL